MNLDERHPLVLAAAATIAAAALPILVRGLGTLRRESVVVGRKLLRLLRRLAAFLALAGTAVAFALVTAVPVLGLMPPGDGRKAAFAATALLAFGVYFHTLWHRGTKRPTGRS